MVELISSSSFKLYLKYALRDLSRSYYKILSIIITLFISLFILSTILTIEDSLETEIKNNSKLLLGGDIEIDYNQVTKEVIKKCGDQSKRGCRKVNTC